LGGGPLHSDLRLTLGHAPPIVVAPLASLRAARGHSRIERPRLVADVRSVGPRAAGGSPRGRDDV